MSGVSYLILYFPICLVIMLVLETCRSDDPRKILKRSLSNFGLLTVVLMLGSIVVFFMNRYL